jgi:pimeloyl-ACP methyl ester carboxylesterase
MLKKILLALAGLAVAGYLAICGYLFAVQRHMVFEPRPVAVAAPPGYAVLDVAVPGIGVMRDFWLPPAAGQPVVVFFHGNAAATTSLRDIGTALHRHGWGVLLAAYPGYSANPGAPTENSLMADARATIAAVPRGSRVIVWGHSLGSGVAARMAAEGRAAGLVLESPFTALPAIGAMRYPYIPVRLLMLDQFDTQALVDRIKVPVLIFHSTDDDVVPFAMGQTLARELGPRASFVRMRGLGHYPHRQDLSGRVVAWAKAQHLAP